jgi:hypothetical protein
MQRLVRRSPLLMSSLIIAAFGCEASGPSPEKADAAPARTWPPDAPASNGGCRSHDECVVFMWDAPSPPDPCCDQRVGFMPATRAYVEWMGSYRKRHCAGVRCEPLPFPGAEPACCASIGRCVDHRCVQGCDDPSLQAPKTSWLDPACRAPQP